MSRDVKIAAALVVAALIGFVAYKKLHKSYAPITFQDKIFLHVDEQSQNEFVTTHFYTVEGKAIVDSSEFLQIINLGDKVTPSLRDRVDQQIAATMRVAPLNGSSHRLFGVMQNMVVYVYLMESTYMIYAQLMLNGTEADYRASAKEVFDAMEWIPADDL